MRVKCTATEEKGLPEEVAARRRKAHECVACSAPRQAEQSVTWRVGLLQSPRCRPPSGTPAAGPAQLFVEPLEGQVRAIRGPCWAIGDGKGGTKTPTAVITLAEKRFNDPSGFMIGFAGFRGAKLHVDRQGSVEGTVGNHISLHPQP